MRRLCICLLLLLGSWQELFARHYREVPELAAIFQKQDLEGTLVLLDVSSDTIFFSDPTRGQGLSVRAEHGYGEG